MTDTRMICVSSKGQIVLPKSFRDKAGIADGDYICVQEVDGILLIEKPVPSRLSKLVKHLRKDAAEQNFTRENLEDAINEVRAEKSA